VFLNIASHPNRSDAMYTQKLPARSIPENPLPRTRTRTIDASLPPPQPDRVNYHYQGKISGRWVGGGRCKGSGRRRTCHGRAAIFQRLLRRLDRAIVGTVSWAAAPRRTISLVPPSPAIITLSRAGIGAVLPLAFWSGSSSSGPKRVRVGETGPGSRSVNFGVRASPFDSFSVGPYG
jgi:hypothetical protein